MSEFINNFMDLAATYVVVPIVLTAQALFATGTPTETLPTPEPLPLTIASVAEPSETGNVFTFPSPPTCEFSASPSSVTQGEGTILSWDTEGGSSVVISEGVGIVDFDGSVTVYPSVTTTYTLTVLSPYGWETCTTAVAVEPATQGCSFTGAPLTIHEGESATLSWATQGVTSVVINQGIGVVTTGGEHTVTPSQTTSYTLTATNSFGMLICLCTVTITVIEDTPTPYCEFSSQPETIPLGQHATLTWTTEYAANVSISPHVGAVALTGNTTVTPLATTEYTLTATNESGDAVNCSAMVSVATPSPTQPTYDLEVVGCGIAQHGSSCVGTIDWETNHPVGQISVRDNGVIISYATDNNNFPRTFTYGNHGIVLADQGEPKEYESVTIGCGVGLSWDGDSCEGTGVPAPTLVASPRIVTAGATDAVTLTWNTNGVPEDECSLNGGNLTNATLMNGTGNAYTGSATDTVMGQTTYTITCGTQSASETVNVIHAMWEM